MRKFFVVCLAVLGLLSSTMVAANAAFPGDNGRIYYERDSGVDGEPIRIVGVNDRQGGGFDNVVEGGAAPAFSPNGRWMAYERPTTAGTHELVIARSDGSATRVVGAGVPLSMPAWSRDGTQLVAVTAAGGLAIVDAATATVQQAVPTEPDCEYAWPVWSPVDDTIAASRTCTGDADRRIVTLQPDGTRAIELTDDSDATTTTWDSEPDWSPDGTQLVFARAQRIDGEQAQNGRIWVMDADGTDAEALTDGAVPDHSPAWSPDGRFLAFSRDRQVFGDERVVFTYWIGIDHPEDQLTWPFTPVQHTVRDWQSTPGALAACPPFEVPSAGFSDAGGVHGEAIDCAVWHGLANGRTASTYEPGQPVRRDQMASFVARLLEQAGVELPEPTSQGFTDIDGNTHADAINQLTDIGVINGIDETRYAPARALTRDQTAALFVRAYEYAAETELDRVFDEFADDDGSTHEHAIERATLAGFTTGVTVTAFEPGADVRRDQMATFLVRTADRFVRDGLMELPQ